MIIIFEDDKYKKLYEESLEKIIQLETHIKELQKKCAILVKKATPEQVKKANISFTSKKDIAAQKIQKFWRRRKNRKKFKSVILTFSRSKEAQMLKERNKIIQEIVKTEKTYIQGLEELQKVFVFIPILTTIVFY